jgi:hypothetical protein
MIDEQIDPTDTETPIRRVRGTALKTYMWERVPRQLLDDARAKCKRQDPPVFLKFKLIELLREWTYGDPLELAYRALGDELRTTPGKTERAAVLGTLRETIAELQAQKGQTR